MLQADRSLLVVDCPFLTLRDSPTTYGSLPDHGRYGKEEPLGGLDSSRWRIYGTEHNLLALPSSGSLYRRRRQHGDRLSRLLPEQLVLATVTVCHY